MVFRGTHKAVAHFRNRDLNSDVKREPVSIIKPVKGHEAGLTENLRTFFELDYPAGYELLFSIASPDDPSRPVIEALCAAYPRVATRLSVHEMAVGPNPKVNNVMPSYLAAANDWILISDSNVRVPKDYLLSKTARFTSDVGIITAVVAGHQPRYFGGALESVFLNTFYARWMFLAQDFEQDVVVGKSMLFRKSTARRFGGVSQLGRFLAEDFMAGHAMRMLGLKVEMMDQPIRQPLPTHTFRNFWSRHIRWGRIRRAQAPLPIFFEPWINSLTSAVLGAFCFRFVFGIPPLAFVCLHFAAWFLADVRLIHAMGEPVRLSTALAWMAREVLAFPLWLQMMSGNTVTWRGNQLRIRTGGLLELGNMKSNG